MDGLRSTRPRCPGVSQWVWGFKKMANIQQLLVNHQGLILLAIALVAVFLLLWNILLSFRLNKIQKKQAAIFSGADAKSLEEIILGQGKSIKTLDKDIQELYNISNQINILAFRGLHKFGMIRFNPFKDVGGDQSFSIALLNGKNNGVVISSLYTREGTRIYSKAILAGKSEKYPLTEEEIEAIKIAKMNEPKKIN